MERIKKEKIYMLGNIRKFVGKIIKKYYIFNYCLIFFKVNLDIKLLDLI